MHTLLKAVNEFIHDAGVLVLRDGRWYRAPSPMMMHDENVSYTTEELSTLDSRIQYLLPELVQLANKQLKGIKADTNFLCYGAMLRNTIDYWRSQTYLVNSLDQRVYYKELNHIDTSRLPEGGLVMLSGFMYEIEEYVAEGRIEVPYVKSTPLTYHWVKKSWLDSMHPGWDARLEVCETLGYEDAELVRMVLTKDAAVEKHITLSGITLSPE